MKRLLTLGTTSREKETCTVMLERYLNSAPEITERLAFPEPNGQTGYACSTKAVRSEKKASGSRGSEKTASQRTGSKEGHEGPKGI